jgi:signal transduction histidine kinase
VPQQHAVERLKQGYDLRQVVAEYRVLRSVIMGMYEKDGDLPDEARPRMAILATMHEAIDRAILEAVDQYSLERDRERDMFVGILGHDLRNPLQAIMVAAERLHRRAADLDSRTVKLVDRIAASAARMARMTTDLLDLTRGRFGEGLIIDCKPIDLRRVVSQTVNELSEAHTDRDIRCLATEAKGEFRGNWDAERIGQLVSNLVGNAIHHGRDPIIVEAKDMGDLVRLEVRNAGELDQSVARRLFEPFVTSRVGKRRGLGLGLYIVREVAKAHGGTVLVESGRGSTIFRVELPREHRARVSA